ncbi:MAG: MmgE/PrpD family protein [Rhodobacteraceae bacterium]|nr:MmgE/PrpD family protein [Paracoccaceae bacterium]
MRPLDFIHAYDWHNLPPQVRLQAELGVLDLLGVAAGGHGTELSRIIRDHVVEMFGGTAPMLFDGRKASPVGVALATGMMIDALDGHDGYNPSKGHVGCVLLPAILAAVPDANTDGAAFMATVAMGYEFGSRVAVAQHSTVADYHSSGSWGAVVAAAAMARMLGYDIETTRHALGIAEYHGPRSQMMRCIDHPTMLKDGSGWGTMAGVSAALLAAKGFTGAPAITVEDAPEYWSDLGNRWLILEQYFKPYPVCRWAHAGVDGVLNLRATYGLTSDQVDHIAVDTFHEAVRLATSRPRNTEEAQYSTSFPAAVAMVRGRVAPGDIADGALGDPEILRLSEGFKMTETQIANARFPAERLARVTLVLNSGERLVGEYLNPKWDHRKPATEAELRAKFHDLAEPVLGAERATRIETALHEMPKTGLQPLTDQLFAPIS